MIGYDVRREGLAFTTKYKFAQNYFAQGNVTFDMSRHLYPAALISSTNSGPFAVAALGIGAGYTDECTTFSVNYSSVYQDNGTGTFTRNQTVPGRPAASHAGRRELLEEHAGQRV